MITDGYLNPTPSYSIRETWSLPVSGYDLHAKSSDRMSIYDTSVGKAARFECRPGDDTVYSERTEVVLGTWSFSNLWKVTGAESSVEYYRFGVKLESPWYDPDVNPSGYSWGTPFQIHGQQGISPALALQLENDHYRVSLLAGDVQSPASAARELALSDSSLRIGEWVEFVIEVRWSLVSEGRVCVYRMNSTDQDFSKVSELWSVPTLQYIGSPQIKPHYAKTGIYRSASDHVSVVHIGPVLRTTERSLALDSTRTV